MQKSLVIAAFLAVSLLTMAASAAEQAAKPTDPQIAHIVYTANLLDIEAAKQALQKSKNDGVRTFAQQMVGDHTTVNNQAVALVKKTQRQAGRQSDEPKPEEGGGRHL